MFDTRNRLLTKKTGRILSYYRGTSPLNGTSVFLYNNDYLLTQREDMIISETSRRKEREMDSVIVKDFEEMLDGFPD